MSAQNCGQIRERAAVILRQNPALSVSAISSLRANIFLEGEHRMAATFKAGDHVSWETSQGTTHGVIKKKITSPMEIKGHHVAATKEEPQYLVVSDKSGDEAAHKPDSLTKLKD
jgi:uncharacterized protein YijF (DUF1287 family)